MKTSDSPDTARPVSELLRQQVIKPLLEGDDAFATTLLILAVDRFGLKNVTTWHPTVVREAMEREFNVEMSVLAINRLFAAITLITTNLFFQDVKAFIDLCNVLAGDELDPTEFNPADAGEVLWGITEASIIYPPDEDFCEDIRGYLTQVLRQDGLLNAPDVLRLATVPDISDQVSADFADDPEMFEAIWSTQRSKNAELMSMLQQNMAELRDQLQNIPLTAGDVTETVQRLDSILASFKSPVPENNLN